MKKIILLLLLLLVIVFLSAKSIRRYSHVKKFYSNISEMVVELGVEHNVPPAVILAIAGLESGYGQGYVAQITGNILSLGANKNDLMLPSLFLPEIKKSHKIIFDPTEIKKFKEDELLWKQRPASLKKDYRPRKFAATNKNLELLKYDQEARKTAQRKNIEDFVTKWLNEDYPFKVFSDARKYLDNMVEKYGKEILFNEDLSDQLIEMLGGKPGSFNFRESWPKKAKWIMNNAELLNLSRKIYYDKLGFEEAWEDYRK